MQASVTQPGSAVSGAVSEVDAAAVFQGHALHHTAAISPPSFTIPSLVPFQRPFSLPEYSTQTNSPLSVQGPRSASVNLPDIGPRPSHRAFHTAAQRQDVPGAAAGHGLPLVCSPGTRMSSTSSRAQELAATFIMGAHFDPVAEAAERTSRPAHVCITQQAPQEARAQAHPHASNSPHRPILSLQGAAEGRPKVAALATQFGIKHRQHVDQPSLAAGPIQSFAEGRLLARAAVPRGSSQVSEASQHTRAVMPHAADPTPIHQLSSSAHCSCRCHDAHAHPLKEEAEVSEPYRSSSAPCSSGPCWALGHQELGRGKVQSAGPMLACLACACGGPCLRRPGNGALAWKRSTFNSRL